MWFHLACAAGIGISARVFMEAAFPSLSDIRKSVAGGGITIALISAGALCASWVLK